MRISRLALSLPHETMFMDAQKLAKVLAMAASDNEAEALHALRTARRLLQAQGSDFVELAGRLADSADAPGFAQAAEAAQARIRMEALEDAVFDLRNELRLARAENERLRQNRQPPAAAAAATAMPSPPQSLQDATRAAAEVIRLRAELDAAQTEILRAHAHEAALQDAVRDTAEVVSLRAELVAAQTEIQRARAHEAALQEAVRDAAEVVRLRAELIAAQTEIQRARAHQAALQDAARDAADLPRLRAELDAARTEILRAHANEAALQDQCRYALSEAGRMGLRLSEVESRRVRLEAENHRLGSATRILLRQLAEAKAQAGLSPAAPALAPGRSANDATPTDLGAPAAAPAAAAGKGRSQYALF